MSARATLVLAAVLWSLGSFFTRILTLPLGLGLDQPTLTPLQLAFFRNLFAGVALIPLLRPRDLRFDSRMFGMVVSFGLMSGLYMSALSLGQAANAILLQNSAPFWVYLIGVGLLGTPPDRRSWRAILVGTAGTVLIVAGNTASGEAASVLVLLMGLGSGITYAAVVLFLTALRKESSAWLVVLNLFGSAAVVGVFGATRTASAVEWLTAPSPSQVAVLATFGAVQMAIPYWLFARGLRSVSPQEAGIITLLEPVLNPIWAFLIDPGRERPTVWTLSGGLLLLGALGWRYLPVRPSRKICVPSEPVGQHERPPKSNTPPP